MVQASYIQIPAAQATHYHTLAKIYAIYYYTLAQRTHKNKLHISRDYIYLHTGVGNK